MYVNPTPCLHHPGIESESALQKNLLLSSNPTHTLYQHEGSESNFEEAKNSWHESRPKSPRSERENNEYQRYDDSPSHKRIIADGLYVVDDENYYGFVINISNSYRTLKTIMKS